MQLNKETKQNHMTYSPEAILLKSTQFSIVLQTPTFSSIYRYWDYECIEEMNWDSFWIFL